MVGREAERDALWQALRTTHASRDPGVVVLRGSAGTGKSRLAHWLAARAHELGVVQVAMAVHDADPGPGQGLQGLFDRALRTTGMDRKTCEERLHSLVRQGRLSDAHAVPALLQILRPSSDPDRKRESDWVRHRSIRQVLADLARGRLLLVVLDDAQWADDALKFTHAWLDAPDSPPALFVLTVRNEGLRDNPAASQAIDELTERPNATSVSIRPLPRSAQRRLVRELLHLTGDVARQVQNRTAGNALFAVQLVGDWVRRGVLVPTPSGFALAPDTAVDLPDDIFALWKRQIAGVVAGLPEGARDLIELAAVLGRDIDRDEWQLVAEQSGTRAATVASVHTALLDRGLLQPSPLGASFAHGMLHEALLRSIHDAGRTVELHAVCAEVLVGRRADARRIARHLLAANRPAEAATPLMDAAALLIAGIDVHKGLATVDDARAAMRTAGLPPTDARWARAMILEGTAFAILSRIEEAFSAIEPLFEHDDDPEWLQWRAAGLRVRGGIHRDRGHFDEAIEQLQQSAQLAQLAGQPVQVAKTLLVLAECLQRQGLLDPARKVVRQLQAIDPDPDSRRAVYSMLLTASIELASGDVEAGERALREARGLARERGDRGSQAYAEILLAEVDHANGEHLRAVDRLRSAIQLYRATGQLNNVVYPQLNLAQVWVKLERWDDARAQLDETFTLAERLELDIIRAIGSAVALAPAVALEAWDDFDENFSRTTDLAERCGLAERAIAGGSELAAEMLVDAGELTRAGRAYELAADQWAQMGRDEDAARVHAAITEMEGAAP